MAREQRPQLEGRPRAAPESLTLREFSDRYVARYEAIGAPATVKALRWRLVRPLREFGDTPLDELRVGEVAAWEASLPPRFRHDVMRSFRMLGKAAVEWGYLTKNPAKTGANPAPAVIERGILTPAEVDALAEEMRPPYGAATVIASWCYLRPGELLGLERRDVGDGVLDVRGTKTARSRRSVPVPPESASGARGAPRATGHPEETTPYTLRHSGLSWALAAGIPAVDVARFGGTSVAMLERTYHYLLVSSTESAQARMDEFMAASEAAARARSRVER